MARSVQSLTCINCPLGCALEVTLEDGNVIDVTGNTCPRGAAYGEKEVTNPTRIVTSTVRVLDGTREVVSGKTISDVPKNAVMEVARALSDVVVEAPVEIGDVLVKNIADTGVDFIATSTVGTHR